MSSAGLLARALGGALIAVSLLLCAEGALRALDLPPSIFEGDPATLWYLRPDLYLDLPYPEEHASFHLNTNAVGLRGEAPPKDGDWTLALGCSTTFGWGVEAPQAWPAQLGEFLGQPVINGGVPGWSSAQGRAGAGRWLALHPTRVILAYGVRDAWPGTPDAQARPTPWLMRSHLAALLRPPAQKQPALPVLDDPRHTRVPPAAYAENLAALIASAAPAEVWLLAFPQQDDARLAPWNATLTALGPVVLTPDLSSASGEDFFAEDPVHLTVAGHRHLAEQIARLAAGPATQASAPP